MVKLCFMQAKTQFQSKSCSSRKAAKHNQILLTRITLPAKLPGYIYNFGLVSCSFLLSRKLSSKYFLLKQLYKFLPSVGLVKGIKFHETHVQKQCYITWVVVKIKRFSQTIEQYGRLIELGSVNTSSYSIYTTINDDSN